MCSGTGSGTCTQGSNHTFTSHQPTAGASIHNNNNTCYTKANTKLRDFLHQHKISLSTYYTAFVVLSSADNAVISPRLLWRMTHSRVWVRITQAPFGLQRVRGFAGSSGGNGSTRQVTPVFGSSFFFALHKYLLSHSPVESRSLVFSLLFLIVSVCRVLKRVTRRVKHRGSNPRWK